MTLLGEANLCEDIRRGAGAIFRENVGKMGDIEFSVGLGTMMPGFWGY